MAPKKQAKGLQLIPTELVETAKIQAAPYNPNVMTDEEEAQLEASLREHGLVLDLVIQRQSKLYGPLVLIGGHKRMKVARRIAEADGVPLPEQLSAKVLDVDDRRAARLNVVLNAIHGRDDKRMMGLLLDKFAFDDQELWSMSIAREDEQALRALVAEHHTPAPSPDPKGKSKIAVTVCCPHCKQTFTR